MFCFGRRERGPSVATPPSERWRQQRQATKDPVPANNNAREEAPPLTRLDVLQNNLEAAVEHRLLASSPRLSGARFRLLREGGVQVCYLKHTRTMVNKILTSKFLRRWETHHVYLNDACLSSKTPTGYFDVSVSYSSMEEVFIVTPVDAGQKFCIMIVVEDGSLLLQANSSYIRDQWFHSILWKKNIFKFRNILKPTSRPEVILKELKSLVDYATTNPLQDDCVINVPIQIVSDLLVPETTLKCRPTSGDLITTMSPLLDKAMPTSEMCNFFSDHCMNHPRSVVLSEVLTPIVHRILKHNVDFGKNPYMRQFIQDYLQALYTQNDCEEVIRNFVSSIHGHSSICPHRRVLPNLVSVCLAAVFSVFEEEKTRNEDEDIEEDDLVTKNMRCYMAVILSISEYDDWRPGLAQILQPVPFPIKALTNKPFLTSLVPVMEHILADPQCNIQDMVFGIREGKESWLQIFCPYNNMIFVDDGSLWCLMVKRLLSCCGQRKHFLTLLVRQLSACLLLALRDHSPAQEALCLMLEWQMVEQEDQKMQIVTTLQSTASGRHHYSALCQRQMHLRELQQKGGPRKLTLPSHSTDEDIARLLSCGSFGNLVCLSLAFTHVTSTCAAELIKLPALRYLNLWATQFGDPGLLMISEHLHKLQVLNLCETPVTDRGIAALCSMTNLRKLNLNSTKLTAETFECLKKRLPGLLEFDVRYTEAW